MTNTKLKIAKIGGFLWLGLLIGSLLAGCGEEATPTPNSGLTPPVSNITNGSNVSAPSQAASGNAPRPQVGADGQITVVAPPATGDNIPGLFFWVKENNIWQGGAATQGGTPFSKRDLGGKQLTKAPALALSKSPALAPDATRVAYAYSPEPEGTPPNIIIGQDIYVIDLKSGSNTLLVKRDEPLTFLDNPYWSADGKYLYFDGRTPKRDAKGQIIGEILSVSRVELATGKRETLAQDGREPVPFADNSAVVYVSVNASGGTYETTLKIYDFASKKSRELLTGSMGFLGAYMPRPSPDGQTIVFSAPGGPGDVLQSPTTPKSGLGGFGPQLGLLALLPPLLTEKKLHGLPFDLWSIKPDGSGLRRLTTLFEDQPMPAWSADGKQILFLAGQGFYTIDPDGKNLVKKSDQGGHGGFSWRDKI